MYTIMLLSVLKGYVALISNVHSTHIIIIDDKSSLNISMVGNSSHSLKNDRHLLSKLDQGQTCMENS